MATLSTTVLSDLAWEWDNNCGYASAVLSGIVGDRAHAKSGGYHISIEDQVNPQNYSVVRVDDKAPPGNWPRNRAAAIDMSMNTADMVKCWNRVFVVWQNRHSDPRAKYFNAFNGWNGVGKAERIDFVSGSRTITTDDHKWHSHDETRRRYVNDPEMKKAKLSVFRGESVQQYLGQSTLATPQPGPVRRKRMTEYLWFQNVNGVVTYAMERPYAVDPDLRWDENITYTEAEYFATLIGQPNKQLAPERFAARKAKYTN